MRKIIMILVMVMVAFGSFAKDFEYKSDGKAGDKEFTEEWKYFGNLRELSYNFESGDFKCFVLTYDVSEEDAWHIIKEGVEFPTYDLERYESDTYVHIIQIPARDYSNRR